MPTSALHVRIATKLAGVETAAWNALTDGAIPYLRHEFLHALEEQGCLGRHVGWIPQHLLFEDGNGRLVAACPMYVKLNSFGEFVFDWAWADACEQLGCSYYPKLVIACPFTPATGPRLLMLPEFRSTEIASAVIAQAVAIAQTSGVSSLHWLFPTDAAILDSPLLLRRLGCQFHWENRGYGSFDDFLAKLSSKRRKEILRERRMVREAGVSLRQIRGDQAGAEVWEAVHNFYLSTFDKHGNYPALTHAFFRRVAEKMGDQILVVLAYRNHVAIGAAYFLVGHDTLYGRYWGCRDDIPGLHFEACYYQGLEYCIANGLRRFEPGAQGEHKISRGFLPTQTWSAHWIAEPRLRNLISRYLERETPAMERHIASLMDRSPYKSATC